jgi:hypothetical protein
MRLFVKKVYECGNKCPHFDYREGLAGDYNLRTEPRPNREPKEWTKQPE